MKKIITLIFLQLLCFSYSQTKTETKIISKINRQLLSTKVLKKEASKKIGWAGGYEKVIMYFKNNTPILIEKEVKEVKHLYLTNGTEKNKVTIINAKFYITNWKKNNYFRIGTITNINVETKNSIIQLPKEYTFKYESDEIAKLKNEIEKTEFEE